MKLLLAAMLVVLPITAVAQGYDCLNKYHKLERLNPNSKYYGALYGDYMNRCAGQERTPHNSSHCYELRAACMKKHQLGEEGQGNCQRYRAECRGR